MLFKAITGFNDSSTQGTFKALLTSSIQGAFDLIQGTFKALSI
jgi:hypothetical protein